MPKDPAFHLPRGVLRKLMQQVGLSPSAATSTGGTQLLRRINKLGNDSNRNDEDDDADNVACDSDGYDTVCDCDDDGEDGASGAAPVRVSRNNRNNNGTLSGRPSDAEPLDASDLNGAGVSGVSNLQSHMDSVIISAIESLRSAYDSLLELENTRQTQRFSNSQTTNNDMVVGSVEDDLDTKDSESTVSELRLTAASELSLTVASEQSLTAVSKQSLTADSEKSLTTPFKQRVTAASEQRLTAPFKQRLTAASEQRLTAPFKQRLTAASEQRLTVASSLNDTTNCREKARAPIRGNLESSSPLTCVEEESPEQQRLQPSSPEGCRKIDRLANQLIGVESSDNRPASRKITRRLLRHHSKIRRQQSGAPPNTASRLAERLDNLELLLLALQQPLMQQYQNRQISKGKLDALAALKRNLGCLQAHLLLLQARELSHSAGDQHKRLDRTWNFRRDWKPVEPKRGRLTVNMLEPAPGLSRRPAKRDLWLLKFLPSKQRRALPQLMRGVGFHNLAPMPGTATAAAVPVTRARGRPVVASHNMRDPRNDVMQRFLHALKP